MKKVGITDLNDYTDFTENKGATKSVQSDNPCESVIQTSNNVHLAQAINYLEAYHMDIGLLINFGNTRLQFKRVMKPKPKPQHPKPNTQSQS